MVSANRIVTDIVEICHAHGVQYIVLSPGSRNAPFIITFQEDKRFECFIIPDERAAGFFALGLAQYTKSIVALCCTSGTAAVNYGPALAEAFYQRIPLVAITADRPKEWINQGIGQSLNQENLFSNYCLKSHSLPSDQSRHIYASRLVNEALLIANGEHKGPVHINVPLYEPLYETLPEPKYLPKIVKKAKLFSKVDEGEINSLAKVWNQAQRKLILISALEKDPVIQKSIDYLVKDPSVVVLSETHSNIYNAEIFSSIDRLLKGINEENLHQYTPDILITFGQNLISKRIKQWLLKMNIKEHWHLDSQQDLVDTYHSLTCKIDDSPAGFLNIFTPSCQYLASDYKDIWRQAELATMAQHKKYFSDIEYSDLSVFNFILKQIPPNSYLQMGNSSTVRYIQLFPQRPDLTYHGNRGVSGIDGCTSTAVGAALKNNSNLTVLISGDISFLYDINGLWNQYLSKNLRIIIVNNQGGGIFRFIPGPSSTGQLESSFEVRHQYNVKFLASTYNLDYIACHCTDELLNTLEDFFAQGEKAKILEVFTPAERNDLVLNNYFKSLANTIE